MYALVNQGEMFMPGDIQLINSPLEGRGVHQNVNVCKKDEKGVHINANGHIYSFLFEQLVHELLTVITR